MKFNINHRNGTNRESEGLAVRSGLRIGGGIEWDKLDEQLIRDINSCNTACHGARDARNVYCFLNKGEPEVCRESQSLLDGCLHNCQMRFQPRKL
jgi:hypothetical protein